ncbi:hypothetical protein A2773_05250 [Candidatus Gottesmanbacteria bacterium RIFCSPHIGHO2_01_FULL_39_10]|uniref:Rhodanese domain-containing protein n=1 Tax=Candidatus Gottesmanbacteria bacterium RIFCSPHIGHO2_01_FULL_39_10 TaxID=1798375 RepID=A0A1F5ZPU7_9BACT|nr:MAG: hypothetical protein A2773_05250 [Candidatus Gottesmanbacteria bacterium RIFCSPHIGHO2_01_FULL_39_10]
MPKKRKRQPVVKRTLTPSILEPKLTPLNIILSIIVFTVIGAIIGSLTTYFILTNQKKPEITENDLIKEFYDIENAVHVSPHSVRKNMDKGDTTYLLVDLRSSQEYEKEHIIGAISIPAYKDPNTSAYGDVDRIVSSFQKTIKAHPKQQIIVYCYSMPCMTGRKVGKMLTEKGIFVKHLGIGWNEWRYFWNLWNHDGETPTVVEDYISSGKDPGTPKIKQTEEDNLTPCTAGDFGC